MSGLAIYHSYNDSAIHRLDPRVKALWVVAGLFFIFSTSDWQLLLSLVLLNVLLAFIARLPLRILLPVFVALSLFGVVMLIFQLLFQGGEVFWSFGPIELHTNGFYIMREAWLRLANLALLFVQYLMWTHPMDITLMWVRLGLPYRFAMMLGLAFRFFPVLQGEASRIMQAQQVRGQALNNPLQRIRGLITLMLPFILRVLRRTNEISVSMELRGFGFDTTRSYLRSIGMKTLDWLVAVGIMVFLGIRIAMVAGWTGQF